VAFGWPLRFIWIYVLDHKEKKTLLDLTFTPEARG
jgi:hypothetical protein